MYDFIKQFPSLVKTPGTILHNNLEYANLSESHRTIELAIENLQENCLDKQNVRDVIKKIRDELDFLHDLHNAQESDNTLCLIEKELEL